MYYRGVTFLFHWEFHLSNRHLSQNIIVSYVCTQQNRHLTACYHLAIFLLRCLFLPHHDACGQWLLQAPSPQHCPIQVQRPHLKVLGNVAYTWFGQIPLSVSNSIVLSLVCIFPYYFSAVLPSHPFCPACVNCWQAPLPSRFPSPPSLLWQRHCHIALALPGLVWHNHPLALALPAPLSHPHRRHHHQPISLPSPPTYVPPLGYILSSLSPWHWCQLCSSKPLALRTPTPMPLLFVPHLTFCSMTMLSPQSDVRSLNKIFP